MDSDIKYKAALYGIALFLTPFSDKILPILFQDKWPSIPMMAGCSLLGTIACAIGLRAYFDGSYEKAKVANAAAQAVIAQAEASAILKMAQNASGPTPPKSA